MVQLSGCHLVVQLFDCLVVVLLSGSLLGVGVQLPGHLIVVRLSSDLLVVQLSGCLPVVQLFSCLLGVVVQLPGHITEVQLSSCLLVVQLFGCLVVLQHSGRHVTPAIVCFGVPQGTILGIILFIINMRATILQ